MRASFRKNTTVYEKPMTKTLNITFSMFINLCFEARLSLHLQNLSFLLAIKVGPYAGTPVAIGLRSRSSMWTWSNGEPVSSIKPMSKPRLMITTQKFTPAIISTVVFYGFMLL